MPYENVRRSRMAECGVASLDRWWRHPTAKPRDYWGAKIEEGDSTPFVFLFVLSSPEDEKGQTPAPSVQVNVDVSCNLCTGNKQCCFILLACVISTLNPQAFGSRSGMFFS